MNVFQESSCCILGLLLVFLLQGSCVDPYEVVVHKAVGDSLEIISDYPKEKLEAEWKYNGSSFAEYQKNTFKIVKDKLFNERLKMDKDKISITIADLKLQDSGRYSIVAEAEGTQYDTKFIVLHVHDHIRDVNIKHNVSWIPSQNICRFHLWCLASGDPYPSYSWSGHQTQTRGPHLNISLRPAESATLTCTANNTFTVRNTTETLVCTEKSEENKTSTGFLQEYWLIVVGVVIVVVLMFSITLAACCWRRRNSKGQRESEADITVYEDVNPDATTKKRTESVVNGMTIYETVQEPKLSPNLPQTLYDKISFQRHPAVSTTTSSPYQEVL